jgi:subtilisin family serine protease
MKRKAIIISASILFSLLMVQMSSMMIFSFSSVSYEQMEIEVVSDTSSFPVVDSMRTFVLHFEDRASFNKFVDTYNPIEDLTFSYLKMVALDDYLSTKVYYNRIEGVKRVFDITDSEFYFIDPVGDNEVLEYGMKQTIQTRDLINVDALWALGYTGNNTVIMDTDTGINTDHVDFEDRILPTSKSFNLLIYGSDINDNSIEDGNGHGTHTAGTAAGAGIANAANIGMAPDAGILAAKIGGPGRAVYPLAGVAAMNYGVGLGIDVINISWGGGDSEGLELTETVVEEMAAQGVVVVCSAGNEGASGIGVLSSPGTAPNAISVAGTTVTGGPYGVSSFGPTAENYPKPDIAAPGVQITSCWIGSSTAYNTIDGTSMAAPHIAGGVLCLIEALKTLAIPYNPGLIKAALMKTANLGTNDWIKWGAGLANFGNALTAIQAAPTNGSGFPVIMYARPSLLSIHENVLQGFHGEMKVQSVSSTPWNDIAPVLSGNITAIAELNTTSLTERWTKNYYLAVNVPDDATLGVYTGTVTFETAAGVTATTQLEITVEEGDAKILYARLFTNWAQDSPFGQYGPVTEYLYDNGITLNEYGLWNITGEQNVITEDLLNQYDAIWLPDPFGNTVNFTETGMGDSVEITNAEITAIQNYIAGGGGMMIDFNGWEYDEIFGAQIEWGTNVSRVDDLISIYGIQTVDEPFETENTVKIPITGYHAVTDGVSYIDHFGGTLSVTDDAVALAKYDGNPVQAIWENDVGGRVWVSATNFILDSSGFPDLYNTGTQNNLFCTNIINWLIAKEKLYVEYVEDATGVNVNIDSLDPAAILTATLKFTDSTGTTSEGVTLTDLGGGQYSYRVTFADEGIYTLIIETADDKWMQEFLYDTNPPVITIESAWTNYTVPEIGRIDFKIEDTTTNIAGVSVDLNGGYVAVSGGGKVRTFSVLGSKLTEDMNVLEVYASDAAGNIVESTYLIPMTKVKTPFSTVAILLSLATLAAIVTIVRRRKN